MRLYARLLLWFLSAVVITAVVSVALDRWFSGLSYSKADARRDAAAAVAVYEQQGAAALGRWLIEQSRMTGVMGMLKDARGVPLAEMPGPLLFRRLEQGRAGTVLRLHMEDEPGLPAEPPAGAPDVMMFERAAPLGPLGRMEAVGPSLRVVGAPLGPRRVVLKSERGTTYRWEAVRPPPGGPAALLMDAAWRVGIGLLVIAAVTLIAARSVTRPVRALERAAQALGRGDLRARAPQGFVARSDELGRLAHTFNDMAQQLEGMLATQRQLLRDVSHELRTPLARLRIAAELARERGEPRDFDRVEQEAEQLEALIQQALMLARLETPVAVAPAAPVWLDTLLQEICAQAGIEAAARNVDLHPDLAVGIAVLGRAADLRTALENVIRNALYYTRTGSRVEVTLRREGKQAVTTVCDCGPGVPEQALQSIFKPFVRVSQARETQSGGAGVGLAIAARAVEMHGGSIAARNRPAGGLCVEIRLPAAGALPA